MSTFVINIFRWRNIAIKNDINVVVKNIKNGKTAILIYTADNFIVADTAGGEHRSIS